MLIDTDPAISLFASDVDDGLAIFLALNSDELEVDGITTVFGNTNVNNTYRIANTLLQVANRPNIPIFKGAYNPTWLGARTRAVQFIIDQIMEHPGEITLVALAPLTNIATAFLLEPRLAENLKCLLIMGGLFFHANLGIRFIRSDFNFNRDSLAVKIVLDQDVETILIGLDVTIQVFFRDVHYMALQRVKTPITEYLAEHLKFWLTINKLINGGQGFNPHDPITMAYLLKKDLFKMTKASLEVFVPKHKTKLPKFATKRYSNSLPYMIPHLLTKDGRLTVKIPPDDTRTHKFKIGISVNETAFLKLLLKRLTRV